MAHGDLAHLAAVLGALGAVLVIVARSRSPVLAGLALVAGAEAGLALSGGGHHALSPAAVALAGIGMVVLAAVAALLVRHPALVTPLLVAAAPFRLPLDFGRSHRFFVGVASTGQLGRLLPLYAVLAAAALAVVYEVARGRPVAALPHPVALPVAAFLGLASLSLLWTQDLAAGKNLLEFFLLPFAVLVAVVARAPFPRWMPRVLAVVAVCLASLFAAVALVEEATHKLLFYPPNLEIQNTYASFFRVTSLFRDPSLYGRHVVLGIAILLAAVWTRRIGVLPAALLVAFLWAGLYFSYSQSSMAALFVVALGVTAAAGNREARRLVAVTAAVIVLVGAGVVAAGVRGDSTRKVTSDRSRRVDLTARVFFHHPLVGVGLGAQPQASRALSARKGPTPHFVSHTTPLTILAELGVLGLAAYAALLAGAVLLIREVRRRDEALGLGLGAVFLGLFVHALFYSGFFEDPVTWLVLGVGASALQLRPEPPPRIVAPEVEAPRLPVRAR